MMNSLNEKYGITFYTNELTEYIERLIDECIGFDIENYNPDSTIETPRILKLYKDYTKTRNDFKHYTKYEYFFIVPKTISGLDWLSTDSFINVVCYQYDSENDMNKDPGARMTQVTSSYLIDNKTTLDSSVKYNSNMIKYLMSIRTNSNSFSGKSVAYFEFGISFFDYADKKYIAGKEFYDVDELTPIIQHEINHVHKLMNLQTNNYKRTYEKLLRLQQSSKDYIKNLVQIIYHCLSDEMNAFVEQFFKEYEKLLNKERNIDPLMKTFHRITTQQRQELANKTSTYKKIIHLEILLNKSKEDALLNSKQVNLSLRKIVYKLFADFPRTETDEKFVEMLFKYLERQLFIFKKRCLKTTNIYESLKDTYLYNPLALYD